MVQFFIPNASAWPPAAGRSLAAGGQCGRTGGWRNLLTDADRAARSRPVIVPASAAEEPGDDSGLGQILDRQLVCDALRQLSPAHRTVLVETFYRGGSTATVARQYVNSADQSGAVPFLGIGDRYILAGAQYDPQVLAGLSQAQIASQLRNPGSPVARAVDGSANEIIAAIGNVPHHQPSR
jgi:hypothetical protein